MIEEIPYFYGWKVKDIEEAFAVKDYLISNGLWDRLLEQTKEEKEKTRISIAIRTLQQDIKDSTAELNKLVEQLEKF